MTASKKLPNVTFDSIKATFVPMVGEAAQHLDSYDVVCKNLANAIVDLRSIHTFKGRPATGQEKKTFGLTEEFLAAGTPEGIDWKGLSAAYKGDLEKLWDAAFEPISDKVNLWCARTGKAASEYPVRKNVGYYIEVALQERLSEGDLERYGIPVGTRAERAKARKAAESANEEDGATNEQGKPVPANVLLAVRSATESLRSVKGQKLPMHIVVDLLNALSDLGTEMDAFRKAIMGGAEEQAA